MSEKDRILILEDERIVAEDIKQTLLGLGYSVVDIVSTGEQALKVIEEKSPDLVLVDIVLEGDMNGIEVTDTIRSRFSIPTIYLTAYAGEETLERAKRTEPYGYIVKPYDERGLLSTIEIVLYKNKMEKELEKS